MKSIISGKVFKWKERVFRKSMSGVKVSDNRYCPILRNYLKPEKRS